MRATLTSAESGKAASNFGSLAKFPCFGNTVVTRSPQAFFSAAKMRSLSSTLGRDYCVAGKSVTASKRKFQRQVETYKKPNTERSDGPDPLGHNA
jgi:hypothetical protein